VVMGIGVVVARGMGGVVVGAGTGRERYRTGLEMLYKVWCNVAFLQSAGDEWKYRDGVAEAEGGVCTPSAVDLEI
jgi:hypothetical protein